MNEQYWNSRINSGLLEIKAYVPGKSVMEAAREKGITDIIKMASNENPLGVSPGAMQGIRESLEEAFQYPEVTSLLLREALGRRFNLSPEQFLIGNGADGIIYSLIMGLVDQGDEVILPRITFAMYEPVVKTMRGKVVVSEMKDMAINLEDILARITEKTKMIWLCNPNNPTGLLTEEKDLIPFLEKIPDHVLLVHDEVYYDFVPPAQFPDLLPRVRDRQKNLFLVRSFSKVYGLAGMRIGYGIGDPELISLLYRIKPPFEVSIPAQQAALGALKDDDFHRRTLELIAGEKEFICAGLEKMGVSYLPSSTNFIALDTGVDGYEVYDKMMARGVIIRPLRSYSLPGHIRVTVGLREWNRRFLNVLEEVLKELR